MKHFLILIATLTIVVPAIGQEICPDDGFTSKTEAKNQTVNGVKEGPWMEYMSDEKIVSRDTNGQVLMFYRLGVYVDGKLTGMVRLYNKDWQLYDEVVYADDKPNGVCKFYGDSGRVVLEVPYSMGKKSGVEKFYNSSGGIDLEIDLMDGKRNGDMKIYYDGKLVIDEPYKNNKRDGVMKQYYDDGRIMREITFSNDKRIMGKSYDENGNETKTGN